MQDTVMNEQKLKCLVYGPSGAGKTVFVGSANEDERTAPLLHLDFEGGAYSLEGSGIETRRITSWEQFNEVYEELASGEHHFKSVALDSASEIHTFALLKILEKEKSTNPDKLEIQHYGIGVIQMRKLLRRFRDLPLHVFITALTRTDTEPREGLVKKPSFTGAFADEVLAMLDIVGYLSETSRMEDKGGKKEEIKERILILRNYSGIRSKVRTKWGVNVANEIIEPTVTKLLDELQYEE